MKLLLHFFIYLVVALLLNLLFPWWVFLPAFMVIGGVLKREPWKHFLLGFLAVFLLWLIMAGWLDIQNEQILSTRIAELIGLPGSEWLWLISGLTGGIPGGLAALTGSLIRKARSSK